MHELNIGIYELTFKGLLVLTALIKAEVAATGVVVLNGGEEN